MKNANATELSRVKIPKLNYASSKKPLWLKDQGELSSSPIILPPIPPNMAGDTPRNAARTTALHRTSIHKSIGSLPDTKQQKRRTDMKHVTPRSNKQAAMEFNVIKELDVTQTIRKKIEQYRKWHDAHHKEPQTSQRRKTTPAETPATRQGENALMANIYRRENPEEVNLMAAPEKPDIVSQMRESKATPKRPVRVRSTDISANSLQVRRAGRTRSSSPVSVLTEILRKRHSAATWKTWRNVNHSDCYTDVKTYMKENELMDEDKERIIRRWVLEVYDSVHMNDEDRYDIDPSSCFP